MLVHGLGLDSRMWERQVPALTGAGYRVITCDLLGHGRSDTPREPGSAWTVDELGAGVLGALDEAGVDRAAVVGFSLGGSVALWLALAAPRRVGALGLVATSAWMGPEAPVLFGGRAALVEAKGAGMLIQPAVERWFTPEFIACQPAVLARLADRVAANHALGYAAACRALAALDLRARLGEIQCPTLVVAGDRDRATPVAMAETLAAGIPGAQLAVLAPTGHLLTEERWAELNAALVAFLARTYPPGGTLAAPARA